MKLHDIRKLKKLPAFLLAIALLLTCPIIHAQTVVSAEYFFDTDPGTGNGTALSIGAASDTVTANVNISTAGLSTGYHSLYVRTLSSDNKWSLHVPRRFYVSQQLTGAEYFFDTDPGVGNGTPLTTSSAFDTLTFTASVSTAGLDPGYHMLFVRTKDENNEWSLQRNRRFLITEHIEAAEYFYDVDPGVGNGTSIAVAGTSDSVSLNTTVSTAGLMAGHHTLYVRTRSNTGRWSLHQSGNITITNAVVAAEYFFDTDPGPGNGTTLAVPTPEDSVNLTNAITVPALTDGIHYLYVRTQDATGKWSLHAADSFNVIVCTAAPARPGSIENTGSVRICPGETREFRVDNIASVTNYIWTVPAGASIVSGQGTSDIIVLFSGGFSADDTVKLIAQNSCGTSPARTRLVKYGAAPPMPLAITGDMFGVCGQSGVSYSVIDAGDYNYAWSFDDPTAQIISGQGTSAITVDFTPGSNGNVYVTAGNGCGTSAVRKAFIKAAPVAPGTITGSAAVCPHSSHTYSIPAIPYASTYTWTGPNGSTISDGVVTSTGNSLTTASTSVTIQFGNPVSNVKVRGNNACGSGGYSSMALSSTCREGVTVQEEMSGTFIVYPNPATDLVNVQFDAGESTSYSIRVIDATGKLIMEREATVRDRITQTSLPVSGLAAGMYHLTLAIGARQYQANFIVQ